MICDKYSLQDGCGGAISFEGTAKLLEGADREVAFKCIKRRLLASDDILTESENEDGHKFYKVTVNSWYAFGKFGQENSQKHELKWNDNV